MVSSAARSVAVSARYLPRRHRHPDRDTEHAQEHGLKKFTPQESSARRELRPLLHRDGGGVNRGGRLLGYTRAQDLVGRYEPARAVAMEDKIDLTPLISPLEEYSTSSRQPAGGREALDTRAEAGRVVARPIRMEAKAASAEIAKLAPEIWVVDRAQRVPAPTDANDACSAPSSPARRPLADLRGRPRVSDEILASLEFNGGSVAGQGLGAFNIVRGGATVEGGAQGGTAFGKAMLGGTIAILKGRERTVTG